VASYIPRYVVTPKLGEVGIRLRQARGNRRKRETRERRDRRRGRGVIRETTRETERKRERERERGGGERVREREDYITAIHRGKSLRECAANFEHVITNSTEQLRDLINE